MRKRSTVAILGRPNVGKSTLFNRILGRRVAVVHDQPGVTRDRHTGHAEWAGHGFDVVDTGGMLPDARDGMDARVHASALVAAAEADVLVLLTDVTTGITSLDTDVAQVIRKSGKPVVLAVNKADGPLQAMDSSEFYQLGLGEPFPISSMHGTGTGELLDRIVALLPTAVSPDVSDAELRIALVGKPNVGKSSMANALLGEDRTLVADEPGTTRDSIDSRLRWHGHDIDLVDTAGLRRQARIHDAVDVFSTLRTIRSIERADVCVLLLDATEPISAQDTRIASFVHRSGRGLVVAFNKWDATPKDNHTVETFTKQYERDFVFATYAPLLFLSATQGTRLHRVLETAWMVGESRSRRIPTAAVNRVIQEIVQKQPPRYHAGGTGTIKYAMQTDVRPPRFALFVNNPDYFHRSYLRFVNNGLRAAFEFPGTVLRIELRASRGRGQNGEEA